jgi:5-carboxymethyl-2-hydroxymuconate isomerase
MPHIIIEHQANESSELPLKELSSNLHSYLSEHETINLQAIKTRTVAVDNLIIGDVEMDNRFLHITILLLSGRSKELKDLIAKNIYVRTQNLINKPEYALSVEIRELGTYYKG